MMKKTRIIISGFVILIIVLTVFYRGTFASNKEIEFFNDRFGIQLPKESEIILSKKSFGALGDGYRVDIFQVSSESMKKIVQKGREKRWSELPLPSDFSNAFFKKISGVTDETITKLLPVDADQGYFMIRNNQTNTSISRTEVSYSNIDNIMMGIINLENNRIYLLSYNM